MRSTIEVPMFSIIMPCFNSQEYIEKAIISCQNQIFKNWELIIINDGSTDKTLNIINSFVSNDIRIRVYSTINRGYVAAVNYGLSLIKGTYFLLLGSDDELTPTLFSTVESHVSENDFPDMIAFRTQIDKSGTVIEDKNSLFSTTTKEFNVNINKFSSAHPDESKILFTRDTSKLFKSEKLGDLRYYGSKGMDADGIFSMLFAHKASSFLCIPIIGYIWYLRDNSLSGRKKDFETQTDRINNWIQFGKEIKKLELPFITSTERYYLIEYFYSIVKWVFFNYKSDCLKTGLIQKAQFFLKSMVCFFHYENISKEMSLFLYHNSFWQKYILPKVVFEKAKKHSGNRRKIQHK